MAAASSAPLASPPVAALPAPAGDCSLVRTFTDNTGNKVRYKAEMTGTPLIYPRIHSLGATLS